MPPRSVPLSTAAASPERVHISSPEPSQLPSHECVVALEDILPRAQAPVSATNRQKGAQPTDRSIDLGTAAGSLPGRHSKARKMAHPIVAPTNGAIK